MTALFSEAWIRALDEAARHDRALHEVARQLDLVIQQTVTGVPSERDDAHDQSYVIVLTPGDVGVRPGTAPNPTITFATDHETAVAIAAGAVSAQSAFIDGRLRVGGDLRRLLEARAALAHLGDPFASARPLNPASTPTDSS